MSDALLSPQVGLTMWTVTASSIALASRRLRKKAEGLNVPLMGVAGAFIFAVQMINFSIPGTGSSGHLGGGLLLAILLGPWGGFLTLASVLTIQALFFADGGLLALGSNIFNLGFFTCLVAYPLVYRPLISGNPSPRRLYGTSVLACIIGLQLGSLGVVLQTALSGMAELPAGAFALLMQPIHFCIALVEGVATGFVIQFLRTAVPAWTDDPEASRPISSGRVLVGLFLVSLLIAGGLSLVASASPDGLEWAIQRTAGKEELPSPAGPVHQIAGRIQEWLSFMPDYEFRASGQAETGKTENPSPSGKAASGITGSLITLVLVLLAGLSFRFRRKGVQR